MNSDVLKTNRWFLLFSLSIGVFFAFSFISAKQTFAATGINQEINFQGRLLNTQGATVPDGYYNIEFKIYQDGDGQSVGDTTGSPAGSLKWTEDYLNNNTQGVKVVNGYLSVELGSINPFGSSINWNQNTLWLSMNIGNTNASCSPFSSCSPDGEMTPMQPLTTAVYALNSNELGGATAASFGQLANNQTWTGTNLIQPTTNITGLEVQQTSAGSPTADIFDVQGAGGSSDNFIQVTSTAANQGAVNISALGSNAVTLTSGSSVLTINGTASAFTGNVTASGTINSQTISAAASFTGTLNVATGYQVAGAATTGNYLRGNGTNFVSSAIQAGDLPSLSGTYLRNVPAATSDNSVAPTLANVVGLTVTGTTGTAATAVNIIQGGAAADLTLSNTASTSGNLISLTQSSVAYTGTAILLNLAAGSGSFSSGNFIDLQKNSTSQFKVDNGGNVTAVGTIQGTSLDGTTGINTGAAGGTQRIDNSGNLVNIGTITSGLINSQTISAAASFTGTLNAATGYKVAGAATTGNYLRGNGTNFVSSAIQAGDLPSLSGTYLRNVPAATSDNSVAPTLANVVGLTVTGTTGTAATAVNIIQGGAAADLTLSNTASTSGNLISLTQSSVAYTGTAILLNLAAGSGSFSSGNFIDLQKNSTSQFKVDNGGNVTAVGTIQGTSLDGTTGINTGAAGGTQRIDNSGNLVNIGTITSGLINSQTISAAASFTGTLNAATGYKVAGAATTGNYLRGNGTNFVSSAIQAGDLPSGSGYYIQNGTATQVTANFNIQSASSSSIGGIIQGASGQTADLLELQDSTGASVSRIDASGDQESIGYIDNGIGGIGQFGNMLLDSETIGGTGWTLSNSEAATQASTTAPDGQTTGTKLANGGVAAGATWQQITNSSVTSPYTLSFWVKAGNSTKISYGIYDSTASAWVGALQTVTTLSSTWQRLSYTGTPGTAGHTLQVYLYADGSTSTTSANYNYVWGAQAVQASNPEVYAPTTGAAVSANLGIVANGQLYVSSPNASSVVAVIQGSSGQTGDSLDIQSSSGTVLSKFDSGGNLTVGSASQFTVTTAGVVTAASTIQGTSLDGTTGINTGAAGGTQRIDNSGNLVNIGTITSGLINSQTISAAASFTGTLNAATGYKVAGAATTGNYLRGNGTNFVSSAIQAGDLPSLSGTYLRNVPAATSDNSVAPTLANVVGLTVTGTTGTAATAVNITGSSGGGTNTVKIGTGATSNVGLLIQAVSSQSASLLQLEDSTNANVQTFDSLGNQEQLGYLDTPYGGLGSYSNLLEYSEQLATAPWTTSGTVTVTNNNTTAPDGNTTATKLLGSTSGASVIQTSSTAPTNANYTFSVWLKTTSSTQAFALRIDGATSGTGTAVTGTATTTWQRFSVTQNTNGFTGNIKTDIFPGGTGGTGTVYAWGAQLVLGSTSEVYTNTLTTTVAANNGLIDNGAAIFQDINNATTAFQIQNSSSYDVLAVDTSGDQLKVFDGTSTQAYVSIAYNDGTSTGTISASSGTTAIGNGTGPINITPGAGAAVTITANAASTWSTSAGLLTIQGNGGLTLNSIGTNNLNLDSTTTGTVNLGANANGKAIQIGNNQNATTVAITGGNTSSAISLQAATSGSVLVGTSNANTVTLGNNNASTVFSAESGTGTINLFNGATAHTIQLATGAAVQTVTIGSTNSTSALTLQAGSGNVNINSNGGNVLIGTSGTTGPVLGLFTDTDATYSQGQVANAGTEVNGAMFYSTTNHDFMCGVAGAWETCTGLLYSNTAASSAINTCTTACAAFSTSYASTIPANYCQAGRTIDIKANGIYSTASTTSPTLAFGIYYGTSTTIASDTQIGSSTPTTAILPNSLSNNAWSLNYTIICYSTTSMNAEGTLILQDSNTTTTTDLVLTSPNTAATTGLTTTSAKNFYIAPTWGASIAGNTITAEQVIISGM